MHEDRGAIDNQIVGANDPTTYGSEDTKTAFNRSLPQEKVRILDKRGGWISLSPLEPQEEPRNLGRLKGEIGRPWAMTSLLDILKETDLRLDFTQHFKSPATREVLDREVLRKRLLSLYAMGTNTGLKRVSTGEHGEAYQDHLSVPLLILGSTQAGDIWGTQRH